MNELTGRELDMLVAEKVLGWERGHRWGNGNGGWTIDGKPYEIHCVSWDHTPKFSSEIAAAMQLVERMQANHYGVVIQDSCGKRPWYVEFDDGTRDGDAKVDSLPEAICLAALACLTAESKETVD